MTLICFTSVCLTVRYRFLQTEQILMKIFGGAVRGPRNNRLDFGGDPNHDPDPGIFKGSLFAIAIPILNSASVSHDILALYKCIFMKIFIHHNKGRNKQTNNKRNRPNLTKS